MTNRSFALEMTRSDFYTFEVQRLQKKEKVKKNLTTH
jgi:hypothetical protein